jgi:hypothetical protein
MLKNPIAGPRAPQERLASILVQTRLARIVSMRGEEEELEEHCLDAMLHWRDPVERLRALRHRHRTLLDDNPSSG